MMDQNQIDEYWRREWRGLAAMPRPSWEQDTATAATPAIPAARALKHELDIHNGRLVLAALEDVFGTQVRGKAALVAALRALMRLEDSREGPGVTEAFCAAMWENGVEDGLAGAADVKGVDDEG